MNFLDKMAHLFFLKMEAFRNESVKLTKPALNQQKSKQVLVKIDKKTNRIKIFQK